VQDARQLCIICIDLNDKTITDIHLSEWQWPDTKSLCDSIRQWNISVYLHEFLQLKQVTM